MASPSPKCCGRKPRSGLLNILRDLAGRRMALPLPRCCGKKQGFGLLNILQDLAGRRMASPSSRCFGKKPRFGCSKFFEIWPKGGWRHPCLGSAGGSWGKTTIISTVTFFPIVFFPFCSYILHFGFGDILNKQTLSLKWIVCLRRGEKIYGSADKWPAKGQCCVLLTQLFSLPYSTDTKSKAGHTFC